MPLSILPPRQPVAWRFKERVPTRCPRAWRIDPLACRAAQEGADFAESGGTWVGNRAGLSLLSQKSFRLDTRLLEDGAERAFRHIAGMVGDGGVVVGCGVEPDFMASRCLAIERKTQLL